MLDVLRTFLGAASAPVKQIHFQGTLGESYVTASNDQIQTAVDQFGRLDVFFANAGFGAKRGFLEESVEHWK